MEYAFFACRLQRFATDSCPAAGALYLVELYGLEQIRRRALGTKGLALVAESSAAPPLDAGDGSRIQGRVVWIGREIV